MTSIAPTNQVHTLRRVPQPGEIGCPGACPLCCTGNGHAPACLACRDELRARLAEMQAWDYAETAVN